MVEDSCDVCGWFDEESIVDPYNELPEDGGIEPPGEGRRFDLG